MGYRSKVIFGVKEIHKDKFNKLIEEVDKIGGNNYHKEIYDLPYGYYSFH